MSDPERWSAAFGRLRPFIGNKTGIVRAAGFLQLNYDDPRIFVATSQPARCGPLLGNAALNIGAAASLNPARAAVRAVGESLERYAAAAWRLAGPAAFRSSPADLLAAGSDFVCASEVYRFAEDQKQTKDFPFSFAANQAQNWVVGVRLMTGEPAYVPMSCTFVPYDFVDSQERMTHMPISTGCAAADNLSSATLSGLLEVIERDAFMISWRTGQFAYVVPRSSIDQCRGAIAELVMVAQASADQVRVWQLDGLAGVPVVVVALWDEKKPSGLAVGVCAAASKNDRIQGAFEEALLTRVMVRHSVEYLTCTPRAERPASLREQMMWHALSEDFLDSPLWRAPTREALDDKDVALEPTVRALEEMGHRVYAVDIATRELRLAGLSVIRIVVSGLCPLDNDARYPHLGASRLSGFCRSSLYLEPHPFP
ncbi:YcaO-like family protein [Variovorax sp. MHTC-1]|uniref:YcaO-like family protein n=1 Tax=Variovorax sp. MHTC-1 TaxID=2495593 RepID=UPI000F88CC16|nr:YcaO-like family protein [Variovorax sp. MHTC-1]RST52656.1 hypothetical protein EJI01_15735 [Variovorax sp. MHTC-1]